MTSRPGPSIPLSEAVSCADCRVVFSSREVACPKCAAVTGIAPVESSAPALEIARLRDQVVTLEGGLLQIVHGTHSEAFKQRLAQKLLEYLRKTERPAATTTGLQRKEINVR